MGTDEHGVLFIKWKAECCLCLKQWETIISWHKDHPNDCLFDKWRAHLWLVFNPFNSHPPLVLTLVQISLWPKWFKQLDSSGLITSDTQILANGQRILLYMYLILHFLCKTMSLPNPWHIPATSMPYVSTLAYNYILNISVDCDVVDAMKWSSWLV